MDQLGIVPPNPFLSPPISIQWINQQAKHAIIQFLEAYTNDPSQYGNKKPIQLIHEEWINQYSDTLRLAAKMGSTQFYQFIIDTGVVVPGDISNRQFLGDCFDQDCFSYIFTKYLLDLCPNRINLIPPNILISIFGGAGNGLSRKALKLFWEYCPQLRNPDFLNLEIRMPPLDFWTKIDLAQRCINDGGYNGDLSSQELEHRYRISFQKKNVAAISYLISDHVSLKVLQSFVESSDISLAPLYRAIDPGVDSQDGLKSLDNLFGSVERVFRVPFFLFSPPSARSLFWYLNWWKNDVLGHAISLNQFKTIVFNLLNSIESPSWSFALPIVEYLGDDFFTTLSFNQIYRFLDTTLEFPPHLDKVYPLLNILLSFPSISSTIQGHCVHFTRTSLLQTFLWDCAELFLKLGGLTMEQIWSDEPSNYADDGNDNNREVFTLQTLVSCSNATELSIPVEFIHWLSYQPGTQEQLIKMVQSQQPLITNRWPNVPESYRRLFLFFDFSLDQQRQRQAELNPVPSSSIPQSMSWLQSFIVYTPVDYMNVKFTLKLWKTRLDSLSPSSVDYNRRPQFRHSPLPVGEEIQIGLCHFPILLNEKNALDGSPAVLLEDIIQGVVAALFIKETINNE